MFGSFRPRGRMYGCHPRWIGDAREAVLIDDHSGRVIGQFITFEGKWTAWVLLSYPRAIATQRSGDGEISMGATLLRCWFELFHTPSLRHAVKAIERFVGEDFRYLLPPSRNEGGAMIEAHDNRLAECVSQHSDGRGAEGIARRSAATCLAATWRQIDELPDFGSNLPLRGKGVASNTAIDLPATKSVWYISHIRAFGRRGRWLPRLPFSVWH